MAPPLSYVARGHGCGIRPLSPDPRTCDRRRGSMFSSYRLYRGLAELVLPPSSSAWQQRMWPACTRSAPCAPIARGRSMRGFLLGSAFGTRPMHFGARSPQNWKWLSRRISRARISSRCGKTDRIGLKRPENGYPAASRLQRQSKELTEMLLFGYFSPSFGAGDLSSFGAGTLSSRRLPVR